MNRLIRFAGRYIVFVLVLANDVIGDEVTFPAHSSVVNVKLPPYNAQGDGLTDDTAALQNALNENVGRHRLIYFPPGEYLISSTLRWPKNFGGRENWGFTYLCGASSESCVIKLKEATFDDSDSPQAMMWCGGFGSADWFHNYIENLTFDVGGNNPGAIALQFYSNNSGAIRNCRFLAAPGSGSTGLDLAHRDMNGPLLVQNCSVVGFQRGIATAGAVNSQVFEHITLERQEHLGFVNAGQSISIRSLKSKNAVPALSTYGSLCLVEADLVGHGNASACPAIINFNGGRLFVRDIHTSGYLRAVGDVSQTPDSAAAYRLQGEDKLGSVGPIIAEYASYPISMLFPSEPLSLRLPIKETPKVPCDPPETWAIVDDFGADPSGQTDSSLAIQAAIDSGATTIFLPGAYRLNSTVIIRGNAGRLVGLGGQVNYGRGRHPSFRVVDADSHAVAIEHFSYIGGGIEIDSNKTLMIKSVSDCRFPVTNKAEGAEWFFEDVVTHDLQLKSQKLWARQLNIENEGMHLRNHRSDLWILGYKTERGGTLVQTSDGGRTEILGGFSYTTTAGKLAPMFVNHDSQMWSFFREICFNGDPYEVLVEETRDGVTKRLNADQGGTWPYSGHFAKPQP